MNHEQDNRSHGVLQLFGPDNVGLVSRTARLLSSFDASIDDALARVCAGWSVVLFGFSVAGDDLLERIRDAATQEFSKEMCLRVEAANPRPQKHLDKLQSILWRVRIDSDDDAGLLELTTKVIRESESNLEAFLCETYTPPRAWHRQCTQVFTFRPAKTEESPESLELKLRKALKEKQVAISRLTVEPI